MDLNIHPPLPKKKDFRIGILWVVPELGPVASSYGISTWPSPWEDAMIAKREFEEIWSKVVNECEIA